MLSKQVRIQLGAFALISAIALAIASVYYIGLPKMAGVGRFTVAADFRDTSGLYPRANVTYRGVDVGQVDALDLTPTGVRVVMKLNDGANVPADAAAEIHSTSAVGEQYVDLVPASSGGPYLRNGSVIPRDKTVEMPQTAPLLDGLDNLLDSLPKETLASLLRELNVAFGGTGPELAGIIGDSSELVATARRELAPTLSLIANLGPFLTQQQQLASTTSSFVTDLASFTEQLRLSDPQLRRLIAAGQPTGTAVGGLVDTVKPTLPVLLSGLVSTGQVIYTYLPALRELLVLVPPAISSYQKIFLVGLPNTAEIDFELNVNNPPPCLKGYLPPSDYENPGDTTTGATPVGLSCGLPSSTPISVRGSRNLPCLATGSVVARAPSVEACQGREPEAFPSSGKTTTTAGVGTTYDPSPPSVATYEPATGRFLAPDGEFFTLSGSTVSSGNGPTTLEGLLVPSGGS